MRKLRLGSLLLCACSLVLSGCDEKRSSVAGPTPPPSPVTVSIVPGGRTLTTTAFSPNPLNITRGTTVTWINNDTSTHDVVANSGAFDTGNIAPGSQASFTFQSAGAFPYYCGRHPGMVATVNVQ